MHAIELIKHLLQVFFFNTNTVVLYRNHQFTGLVPGSHVEHQVFFGLLVFHRVIHQVEYHIGDMHFVRKYNRIGSLKVRCNLTIIAFHLQSERIDNSGNQLIGIEFLHLQRCFLPVEHRHLKHLLHLESQPLRFIIDDSRYMLEHLRRLPDCGVFQHLGSKRDGRYRCLELMRHVVDKVILHLCQLLLTEDDVDGEDECNQQYDSEYHRRNHKTNRVEDIIFLTGKVHLHNTHLRRRIILEQRLRIRVFTPSVFVVRATIYFTSIFIDHRKMVEQLYTIINKVRFQIIIQLLKVHPFANRFIACLVNHPQSHIVEQKTLIHIPIFNSVSQAP